MEFNFREALAILSRALLMVLFRAGIFAAGGFILIIIFGMVLFAFHLTGGVSPAIGTVIILLAVLGVLASILFMSRYILYRFQVAILLFFSGYSFQTPGLATVMQEVGRFFPAFSDWAGVNRGIRRALSAFYRSTGEFAQPAFLPAQGCFSEFLDRLAIGPISQAILVLAFSRGGSDLGRMAQEGLALYFSYGQKSRCLARKWLTFSAAGLVFLFLCLALPNWFFFRNAGAPVVIGIILAIAIAWLLYQAFIVPFALAGVSASLLSETRTDNPDSAICEKLNLFVPGTGLPGNTDLDSTR